ncbi:alpha/beta hydrolase-fold protein [Microbacterium sp. PRC9]|uniref:alpha/beta hydrolase n=1 Tax=Microbacterium sp. PRC9 TaxID=2962591 RepID=UPI002880CC3C|nr:alpha/beta hydrolase-fold protein [Microbacterium sp. PRC9]MDT0144535.1 alpha/beta hydrolase-fold protein [Microbacterium sp. PRC9]
MDPFEQVKIFEQDWLDPISDGEGIADFVVYPQPARGQDAEGSAFVYLPPTYPDNPEARFPVLYWLHGGFAHSHQSLPGIARIDAAIRDGRMPEIIVVAPQGLPIGWYLDSKDGARPMEQITARDLVSFVDATYRTIPDPSARALEGFSMGGYGSLHLGLKHPDLFGRITAIGPSILRDMSLEPAFRTDNTFFGDEDYFAAVSPWTLLLANAPELRERTYVRLLNGKEDNRLADEIRAFGQQLADLGIPHEFREIENVAHDYLAVIDALGDDYFAYWRAWEPALA